MTLYPIILCGGGGARLWPSSTADRPKPFVDLTGGQTMFQQTVLRLVGLTDAAAPVIVAGIAHRHLISAQLAPLDLTAQLILEPEGRDSAPAIAAAVEWISQTDPDALALVVAADHDVPEGAAFRKGVEAARSAARAGAIVTFGVAPTSPSTAYGYIRPGAIIGPGPAHRVDAFVEKPTAAVAQTYLEQGYLWNSGNFVFALATFRDELQRWAPDIASAVGNAVANGVSENGVLTLGGAFAKASRISIDYAVLERSSRVAVAPVSYPWSDLGSWEAVMAASPKDADGNALRGGVQLLDTRNSLARVSTDQTVALVGVRDIAVIVEDGAVLVCDLSASQNVKSLQSGAQTAPPNSGAHDLERQLAAEAAALDLWFRSSALPLWSTLGRDHAGFGFHEAIDPSGRPFGGPRRLRVQARQAYVYALAGTLGWAGPWREALDWGLKGLETHYRRSDGAYRTAVDGDGEEVSPGDTVYDQAFVLLALAAVDAVGAASDAASRAAELLRGPLAERRHAAGGYREPSDTAPFQSNPHMHVLEAALAWEARGGAGHWIDLADEIVDLALKRFIDEKSGAVREYFDENWRPLHAHADGQILPGHQFEWAWLLEDWATRRGRSDVQAVVDRLYAVGLRGIDRHRNVAVNALYDDFTVHDANARLWPQTERLRATLRLARRPGAGVEPLIEAIAAARCLRRYLETPVHGLWWDTLAFDGRFVTAPAPATNLYHIAGAIAALR